MISVHQRHTGQTDRRTDIIRCHYPPMLCMVWVKSKRLTTTTWRMRSHAPSN